MRQYTVAVAALAIGAPTKWVDNLLSQHDVINTVSGRRGVARRISHQTLVRLALLRQLHADLGLSVADAIRVSSDLLDSDGVGVHETGHLRLTVDARALETVVDTRLRDALESAPSPRRGRPPVRSGSGTTREQRTT